ncbi:MAG: SCO family protein [Flavobacteriales bacterium]|nr:SCO family protein [Flavobacteriales bacterium]
MKINNWCTTACGNSGKPVVACRTIFFCWIAATVVFVSCNIGNEKLPGTVEVLKQESQTLPYLGQHDVEFKAGENGVLTPDTAYYTITKFVFTNQYGKEISHRDYEGKIYVTDFFFTTCPSICPVMSAQLARLQDLLKKENHWGEVKILSHTVDPTHDTPEVLKVYAEKLGADLQHWNFVTGKAEEIYTQAQQGYFLTAMPSDTAAGGFFHSDMVALVDRNSHLRGFYDGTSTREIDSLFIDIKTLLNE